MDTSTETVYSMDQTLAMVKVYVDRPSEEERQRFTRTAAVALAKEMVARGCVKVNTVFKEDSDVWQLYAVVRTGRAPARIPVGRI